MKSEKFLHAIGNISDDLITDANITIPATKRTPSWVRWTTIAACLFLLVAVSSVIPSLLGNNQGVNSNPLVITVYARDAEGSLIPTELKVGEKVKLSPATSPYAENFDGYAFDLTLLRAKYVCTCAVDENWMPKIYISDGNRQYTSDDFHWSFTEGDAIRVVAVDKNGDVVSMDEGEQPYIRFHGPSIIWRPNDDGMNRSTISVYSNDFEWIATYYLEITVENSDYFAEVVKIEQQS